MNQNTTTECIPSPAGDPWITCRSKSHHRRIYYYNTVTGEAVWYLTDFENDKSKKTTKVCVDPHDRSDSYPEPREPPQDRPIFLSEANEQNINNDFPSTIFNQKYINNEPFIDHSLLSKTIVQRCDIINPLDDFKFSVPAPPISTPNTSLSNINQLQIKTDLDYNGIKEFKNNYVHTTSVSLNKRFQIIKNDNNPFLMLDHEEKLTNQTNSEFDNFTQYEIDPAPSTNQNSFAARDLRQILSLKRQSNIQNNISQQIYSKRAKVNIGTLDISNFEEHHTDNIIQNPFMDTNVGTSDVQNGSHKSEDCIYLVPDAFVLQNHIYFLKFLLKFGETFHFLVLENVMEYIRNKSTPGVYKNDLTQLAMTFIYGNIKKGFVSIVKNPFKAKKTGPFHLVNCCLKLVEEHDKIILLSNNKQLKKHKNADRIYILTINEMKSIVNTLGDGNLIRKKLYPNETCEDVSMQQVSNEQENVSDCDMIEGNIQNIVSNPPTKVSIEVGMSNSIEEKYTVDASVQTDLDSELINRILNTESVKTILADSVKLKEELNKESRNSFFKVWDVNLNGPSPKMVTKDVDNNVKQRNFKWRRKKPRSLNEQKEEIQKSLTKDIMIQIPKQIVCTEVGQIQNKCNVSVDDVPGTDGSSSSGIVSNTPSFNYWSEYENTRNLHVTSLNKEINDTNNVMFEVTSPAMYENLKASSDEWVSRFVQIMEEALTQVLQKNPSESPNVLPPPWTLFEATTCVKMKYRKDCDIVDAGNKLTNTLTKISDQKGTVNIHLTPKQYMEMYSYGVYLIDTLQAAFEGCEDLQTASESLSKLLYDIQHPNLSIGQNDAFVDVQEECTVNTNNDTNRETIEKAPLTKNVNSLNHQKKQTDIISSPSKNKTISKFINENNSVEEREKEVRSIFKVDSKTSLISLSDLNISNDYEKESMSSEEARTPLYEPHARPRALTALTDITSKNSNNDSKQPKIFISFTQRADYEEKFQRQALELNDKDSEESYLNNNDDYMSEGEYDNYESNREWPNHSKNFGFENIFNNMLIDIRQTFIIVFAFCMTCQRTINISDPERKFLEAKEVHLKINNICNVLSRIIKRDDKLFVSHIAEVLKSEEMMDDFKLEVSDLRKYKEVITKYFEQANSLRECVETILKNMN